MTGAISHETSTFTPVATTWESYQERHYLRAGEIIGTFRGTNTPTGGFIDGAEAYGFELKQPFDTAFSRTLGLDPRKMTYIGVKSAAHFRSGFEPWAGAIYVVSESSVHNPATGALPFTRLGRKLYPFHEI